MLRKIAALDRAARLLCGDRRAADEAKPEEEKPVWKAPFGGTFTAGATFATDYSYRGISQTQRQVAFQPTITYETPTVSESLLLSAYVGAWASNVYFPGTNAAAEVDLIGGFRYKGYRRQVHRRPRLHPLQLSGRRPRPCMLDFNEFGLVVGYDFGPVQLSGAVRYSPNFFANSGIAWYKWAQATVPLPFINFNLFNDPVSAKLFGTIGSQYVERNVTYGIPNNDYWDWQLGATVTVYGVDLTVRLYRHQHRPGRLPEHPELRRPLHLLGHQDVLGFRASCDIHGRPCGRVAARRFGCHVGRTCRPISTANASTSPSSAPA